ncbi:MAG TPA: hypothetical protein VNZ86_10600 [Bacteroidia bacterium]|jgi:membrane-bound serine protease (ClpP class)|nr:hypothetical protein [Bacteroidia bacterium]
MSRTRVLLFLLILIVSLHLPGLASSIPGLLANTTANGFPVTPENSSTSGKNPFSIHITLGFPAEIREKQIQNNSPVTSDSTVSNTGEKKAGGSPRIYEYDTEPGNGTAWHHTSAALRQAMNLDADMVYIHINPFADFTTATADIRNKLTEYNKPVTVFLDNGSDKKGAIISVRSETPGTSGHKAGVKTSVYALDGNQVREKYKTYVNSMLNGDLHPAVQSTPAGLNLITSNTASATDKAVNRTLRFSYQPRMFEKILDFLLLPFVSFLLMLGMGLGLLFEIRKPGQGFPLFAAIFSAVLFFTPLRLDGLAENYEILLFVSGVLMVLVHFIWLNKFSWMPVTGLLLSFTGLLLCLEPSWQVLTSDQHKEFMFMKPLLPVSISFFCILFVYYLVSKRDKDSGRISERDITYAKAQSIPG